MKHITFTTALILLPAIAHPQSGGALGEKAAETRVVQKVEKARQPTNLEATQEGKAVREFQKALTKYAALHDNLLARLGRQQEVTAQALAQAIGASRAQAKAGDVFIPEIQPLLRRLIGEQLRGPDASDARKTLLEGNVGGEEQAVMVEVRINAVYPSGAAHTTMPPSVLLSLPKLPPSLHYRFVDRDLILVDSVAQIVVDYLSAVAPRR